jgi:hypothetical protein
MLVLGHLAVGTLAGAGAARLQRRPPKFTTVLLPAILGGITPDLLDKPLMALDISRDSRTVGHSLVFLAGITVVWALFRAWRGPARSQVLGFGVLGVGAHLLADLCDDAVRGLFEGGLTFHTFFAWPFARPYAWGIRNHHPLGMWPLMVTPLEVAVVLGALLWLVLVARRAWRGRARTGTDRAREGVSAETRSSPSPAPAAPFATFHRKRGNPEPGAGGGP